MGILGTMTVNFTANIAGLTAGTAAAKANLAQVAGGGALVAGALVVAGGAAIAAGAQAVKMAGDFQSGMTSLVTGAGESQKNIGMVSQGILDLAVKTGTSTKQLADGMYMIESAGYHGGAGLDVLKNAAMGAKVGNADLGAVANAVTTEMTNYATKNLTASQATNTLVATVAAGKTHMQDLALAMANVLPIASKAGISLTDTSAAMATMTAKGIPAADAATYLRQTIMAIENPTSKASKEFTAMGLSSADVAVKMKTSLPDALQMITDAAGKKFPVGSSQYIAAVANMVGGTKSMQGIMNLTGSDMATFRADVGNISDAVKKGGDSVNGWGLVQQDFNFKMAQAHEVVETLGIKIGTALMPAVTQLGNAFNFLIGVGTNVVSFFNNNQAAMTLLLPVIGAVAGVIGGILVAALVAGAIAAWSFILPFLVFAAPFILVGAIIGVVVVGIILAIQHWGQIVAWLQGIWGAFTGWFMGILGSVGAFFVGLWNGIASFFVGVWSGIVSFLTGVWSGVINGLKSAWGGVTGFFVGLWNGIISFLQAAWGVIVNIVKVGALLALAVLFLPIVLMVAAFLWLYNHNYYFKALVDSIVNFFKGCFTWAVGAWQGFVGWLGGLWNGAVGLAKTAWNAVSSSITTAVNFVTNLIKAGWQATIAWLTGLWNGAVGLAKTAWDKVSSAIQTGFNASIAFVRDIWNKISSLFVNAWSTYIANPLHTLWDNVVNVFSSAWGRISGPLGDLWTNISGKFAEWATKAIDFGKGIIQGIIDGISGMLGKLGDMASSAAKTVTDFLGFHSPTKLGPGAEADKWAPNFVKMYAAGLEAGIPTIQASMNKLSAPLAASLKVGSPSYPSQSNSSSAILAAVAAGNAASSNSNQSQEIHIYIDGKEVTSRLGPHIANAIRASGSVRSR